MWIGAITVAVILIAGLLSFGLSRDPTLIRSPLVGRRAPEFALPNLDGPGRLRLSDFRGQVVVINFWASWCLACRQEHPNFVLAWNRYRDQGVVFMGVVYQDSARSARAYMREMGGDWPNVVDADGRTALAYGVYGVPETFFVDRGGVVRYKRVGATSYGLLLEQIQDVLARGSP